MSDSHASQDTLESILNHGAYLVVSGLETQVELLRKAHALLRDGVESLQGASARRLLESRGLRALHEVLPAGQIGMLRDFVMPQIRPGLLTLACHIGRTVLGIQGQFFVDDYTILRINYPYLVALQASQTDENPGIGRVSDQTRRESAANRVVDPVYDPKGFHNNEPPPAWAHGPHQDTWTGHSRFGVNLWWALEDVPEECSMVFYPETFGRRLEPDPRSLYLKAGQPLPKPAKMALRCGELLVFNPELLHGTHLNTTAFTRLALSMRINPRQPKFDPNCFYAREFWHSSANIESGRLNAVIRFPRGENLEAAAEEMAPFCPTQPRTIEAETSTVNGAWQAVCASERICPGEKALFRLAGSKDILLMRGAQQLHAVQSHCAHLNVSLADGHHDDQSIWCPAHAVEFSLASGRSSCSALTLQTYEIREEQGTIWLRLNENGPQPHCDTPGSFAVLPIKSRQRLTVNILTRDSEKRLERLLADVSSFADEVLVGVDAASVDRTLEVATGLADIVYQFRHSGQLAPARMLPFDYASGDWILSLDDDEEIEASFDAVLPELLSARQATHYLFPRKWIVNLDPCEYLHADPWFPDWQLRLFRNDRSLVWKPPFAHSGYRVQGPGSFETRASILHFEPVWCSSEARRKKLELYRQAGSDVRTEVFYAYPSEAPRRGASRRLPVPSRRRPHSIVHRTVHELLVHSMPPWRSTITSVDMPRIARVGETILAEVVARNTGSLAWTIPSVGRSPLLQLGCHFLDANGRIVQWDGPRTPMLRFVPPGDTVVFIVTFQPPALVGDYLVEWDFVSESECWFADCGSPTFRTELQVIH